VRGVVVEGGLEWLATTTVISTQQSCPSSWTQITSPVRGCAHTGWGGCVSSLFSTQVEFSQVCGRTIAIQNDTPNGFGYPDDIEGHYVDGVSITHGSPRQHIWSFATYASDDYTSVAYICPCSQPSLNVPPPPSFVGNNYFCDTAAETHVNGWHPDDPLWDGQGCPSTSICCSFNNPPWFSTTLPQSTTDDIEVRTCNSHDFITIILLDLYIK